MSEKLLISTTVLFLSDSYYTYQSSLSRVHTTR